MKIIFITFFIAVLSACNAVTQQAASDGKEAYRVAGSEERKAYCKRRRTHTQKDYFDCVKGYGGQHSEYSRGVIYSKKGNEELK